MENDKRRHLLSQRDASPSAPTSDKRQLESLFLECIEEVRKDVMKRRLKNEVMNKKKFKALERNSVEAKEFEESLIRLAQLAKNKIKFDDFTSRDKCNILDLFVNNERTMLSIYESLFPHRKAALGFTGASAPSHTRERGLSYD